MSCSASSSSLPYSKGPICLSAHGPWDVLPVPIKGSLRPLQPYSEKYHDNFLDMVAGAKPWGSAEGLCELNELHKHLGAFMWQSRTMFSGKVQDWTTYPPEAQEVLDKAFKFRQSHASLTFEGKPFVVDLHQLQQTNAKDPTKVREVRRINTHHMQWILVSKNQHSYPRVLRKTTSTMIDQGLGTRHLTNDAVLHEVEDHKCRVMYIDKARSRAYDTLSQHKFRSMFALPASIAKEMYQWPKDVYIPEDCHLYGLLHDQFESTKFGGRKKRALNDDVHVHSIICHLRRDMYIQFMEKLNSFGNDARLIVCFHGCKSDMARQSIVDNNFSMERIGQSSGNQGWFGKGIYLGRRAYTALGYNNGSQLLCCIAVVKKVFVTPPPDSKLNPFHGKTCVPGYDAHLSPSGKELVIFNPRQILPCFTLNLSKHVFAEDQDVVRLVASDYDKSSVSDYFG